ncbi:hypothetical protein HYR99_01225 [Candidatus Poribacteria bacterium]|nr:hypothetical protein [Candidatus Poribacteria bacterium]
MSEIQTEDRADEVANLLVRVYEIHELIITETGGLSGFREATLLHSAVARSFATLGVVFALLVWVGLDLYVPHRIDIRAFDPKEVARLDTIMWRSYYEKEHLRLFLQLAELMRTQYHFPFLKSHVVAYRAAKAAFIFKGGHSHADYEKALPDLVAFIVPFTTRAPFLLSLFVLPGLSLTGGLFTGNALTTPLAISSVRWRKPSPLCTGCRRPR